MGFWNIYRSPPISAKLGTKYLLNLCKYFIKSKCLKWFDVKVREATHNL